MPAKRAAVSPLIQPQTNASITSLSTRSFYVPSTPWSSELSRSGSGWSGRESRGGESDLPGWLSLLRCAFVRPRMKAFRLATPSSDLLFSLNGADIVHTPYHYTWLFGYIETLNCRSIMLGFLQNAGYHNERESLKSIRSDLARGLVFADFFRSS